MRNGGNMVVSKITRIRLAWTSLQQMEQDACLHLVPVSGKRSGKSMA